MRAKTQWCNRVRSKSSIIWTVWNLIINRCCGKFQLQSWLGLIVCSKCIILQKWINLNQIIVSPSQQSFKKNNTPGPLNRCPHLSAEVLIQQVSRGPAFSPVSSPDSLINWRRCGVCEAFGWQQPRQRLLITSLQEGGLELRLPFCLKGSGQQDSPEEPNKWSVCVDYLRCQMSPMPPYRQSKQHPQKPYIFWLTLQNKNTTQLKKDHHGVYSHLSNRFIQSTYLAKNWNHINTLV